MTGHLDGHYQDIIWYSCGTHVEPPYQQHVEPPYQQPQSCSLITPNDSPRAANTTDFGHVIHSPGIADSTDAVM